MCPHPDCSGRTRIPMTAWGMALLLLSFGAQAGFDPCAGGSGPVFTVSNQSNSSYRVNSVLDPTLTLVRGCTYTFNISASGHPFVIKTVREAGSDNAYDNGIVGNRTEIGTMTWTVQLGTPDLLYYVCEIHSAMSAPINIIDAPLEPPLFINDFE